MPCNSDYMNPTDKERELQRTAQLYIFALGRGGFDVPQDLRRAAANTYCTDDFVSDFCAFLNDLRENDEPVFNRIVYTARDKDSRAVADWWETHQEADRKRETNLERQVRIVALKQAIDQAMKSAENLAPGGVTNTDVAAAYGLLVAARDIVEKIK